MTSVDRGLNGMGWAKQRLQFWPTPSQWWLYFSSRQANFFIWLKRSFMLRRNCEQKRSLFWSRLHSWWLHLPPSSSPFGAVHTGQTSSSSCLGPTVAVINRPRLCLWPLFSNCPLFLEAKWLQRLSIRQSLSHSLLASSPFPFSLSFSHCAQIRIPAPPFLSAAFALVWSLETRGPNGLYNG